jgi:hypothetical protein
VAITITVSRVHGHLRPKSAKQSAQPRATPNRFRGAYSSQPAIRRVELESAVRSLIVVMVDVLVQDPLQVTPATNASGTA